TIQSDDRAIPSPAISTATAAVIAGNPARTAAGTSNAQINGTAGVGQKNNEITYVTMINTKKEICPFTITFCIGWIIRRSAPRSFNELSNAIINVIIKNILNNSVAATIFALKIEVNPATNLPLYTHAIMNVPSRVGNTPPRLNIIVNMIRNVKYHITNAPLLSPHVSPF